MADENDHLAPWRDRIDAARAYDGAHPNSPFYHLFDPYTGHMVQFRRDECSDCYGVGVLEGELCPLCKGRP